MAPSYNPFGWSGLKRNYSLIPLVAIIGGGVGGAAAYVAYMCATKQDISFRPWKPYGTSFTHNPHEIRKLYNIHPPRIDTNPEIEALKHEIGSYGALPVEKK